MSDPHDSTPAGRERDSDTAGTEPVDAGEAALTDEGSLDGADETSLEPREEQELRAQLAREMRFDGFEQGIQG
ncbi:hypothetical protein LQ938_05110 [Microbacterium sp. cx-55]|uniref:hypothetical protein n=1 Tax=Microbacterium sp. cx-55 TaxID=2875948 RepID=UPI001CC0E90C|nr:hypothetical protein [Microbacterium sp. cx-55]MBZ4488591.1 hypothetical protein [Microbacterium sp. cx-55]UGB36170.1 hypothetical protein LQ938_05110 [Microbacterium sp. cx-55]